MRAAPAGVRRTDHAGPAIGEQHRGAIGGYDAEQQPRPIGDQRVRLGPRVVGPRLNGRDSIGRMDLVDRCQRRAGQHCGNGAPPILLDGIRVVVGSMANLQARDDPARNAAPPGKEAVRDTREGFGLDRLNQGCG